MLIVLQHGIFGFGTIALPLAKVEYFWGIADRLAAMGHRVITPGVSPVGSIKGRAERLEKVISENAREGEKILLIGHSMGGLDGRFLLAHGGMAERVSALVTIGTPHRGSPMADAVLKFDMPKLSPLRWIGVDDNGLRNLATRYLTAFNKTVKNRAGVRYYAVPTACREGEVPWFFRISHGLIAKREGENDGMVSVASAVPPGEVGEWVVEETWPVDHLNAAGMRFPGMDWSEVGERYEAIVRRVMNDLDGVKELTWPGNI